MFVWKKYRQKPLKEHKHTPSETSGLMLSAQLIICTWMLHISIEHTIESNVKVSLHRKINQMGSLFHCNNIHHQHSFIWTMFIVFFCVSVSQLFPVQTSGIGKGRSSNSCTICMSWKCVYWIRFLWIMPFEIEMKQPPSSGSVGMSESEIVGSVVTAAAHRIL